jgi:hypothetical protein
VGADVWLRPRDGERSDGLPLEPCWAVFFYSTKMGTDSPSGRPRETHGTLAHGNTRAKSAKIIQEMLRILAAPHNLSSIIHSDLMFMILFLMEEKEPGLRAFVKKSA